METGPEPTQLHQGTENETEGRGRGGGGERLYRVLLLVRWRRKERQIVSGLRRKNTEHTHTRTHTWAPLPACAPGGAASGPRLRLTSVLPSGSPPFRPLPLAAPGIAQEHRES